MSMKSKLGWAGGALAALVLAAPQVSAETVIRVQSVIPAKADEVHMLSEFAADVEALIAFDTQNPPRNLKGDSLLFEYLRTALGPEFEIEVSDYLMGRISFLAVRGEPELLFNVHLDTVPVLDGAKFPPLKMKIHDDRVYGRGACDIKGAAACLLTIAQRTREPLALLFTTDDDLKEVVVDPDGRCPDLDRSNNRWPAPAERSG